MGEERHLVAALDVPDFKLPDVLSGIICVKCCRLRHVLEINGFDMRQQFAAACLKLMPQILYD